MLSARVVVDTNVLVSRTLILNSVASHAVRRVADQTQLLVSEATLTKLAEVLTRQKFDAYVSVAARQAFFQFVINIAERVPITATVRACRDPKDDKFLELAASGGAHWIVSGDQDLLTLTPYEGCAIVTPAQFLALPESALTGATDTE